MTEDEGKMKESARSHRCGDGIVAAATKAEGSGAVAPPRLATFARDVLRSLWEGYDIDGADVQDLALKHGLIFATRYDPARHEDAAGVCPVPGDAWFEEVPALAALAKAEGRE